MVCWAILGVGKRREEEQAGMVGEPREAKHAPSLHDSRGETRLVTAIASAIRLHLAL